MSAAGPELPPHLLAKRKRQQEEQAEAAESRASGASCSSSPDGGEKRRRVLGPSLPPAPLSERPSGPADGGNSSSSDDDDDDDGFGPALPSAADRISTALHNDDDATTSHHSTVPLGQQTAKRDDWMMVPPKQEDLAGRTDPTKIRARKFQSGTGAKAPPAAEPLSTAWTETPEERRKRLADEMMGVAKPPPIDGKGRVRRQEQGEGREEEEKAARRIREHAEKTRGKSLYQQHQKSNPQEKEDDPSKRAFDREKDVGGGMKIGTVQRREVLNNAANFSSKFSKGSFL
ncbi:hypothetical protein LTR66_000204 [Elasticomyces elasticus]|nr:hypothetical protein LTR66_000204 [Elasticomyces elasticus]